MLLAIDIGNSDITFGLHHGTEWKHIWRLPSSTNFELFYAIRLRDFFLEESIQTDEVQHIILSSVVPRVTDTMIHVSHTVFGKKPLVLDVPVYSRLPVQVLNPYEIGSDLVANAVAAFSKSIGNSVVVDFGTALTFTTIASTGEILGVAIAPGLKTAIRSLSDNTARLFEVPLEMPSSILGKNTIHAIQAGILFGYEGMVRNNLQQIRKELGSQVTVIATGGLVHVIPSLAELVDRIEPNLTLDGLRIISGLLRNDKAS